MQIRQSHQLSHIWTVELKLLIEFVRVCDKHGLKYFLDAGTLLGAARHKGFIPWDDDIDVIMPREDYDKLWTLASSEFKYPYFFQTTLSEVKEGRFCRTHAQLRDSNTTGFIETDRDKNINKGIFIDIFPLDAVPDSLVLRLLFKYEILLKRGLMFAYCARSDGNKGYKLLIQKFSEIFFKYISFRDFFDKFNRCTLGRYKNQKTRYVGDLSLKWRENVIWERKWFEDEDFLIFENKLFRVPKFYKLVLNKHYGDWENIPSGAFANDMRVHTEITFDPNTPYEQYFLKKKREI